MVLPGGPRWNPVSRQDRRCASTRGPPPRVLAARWRSPRCVRAAMHPACLCCSSVAYAQTVMIGAADHPDATKRRDMFTALCALLTPLSGTGVLQPAGAPAALGATRGSPRADRHPGRRAAVRWRRIPHTGSGIVVRRRTAQQKPVRRVTLATTGASAQNGRGHCCMIVRYKRSTSATGASAQNGRGHRTGLGVCAAERFWVRSGTICSGKSLALAQHMVVIISCGADS